MQHVLVQGSHRELQRVGHGPKPNPSPGRGTERPGPIRSLESGRQDGAPQRIVALGDRTFFLGDIQ
jgi:hypothetical protein